MNELLQPEGITNEGVQLLPGTSHLLWIDADALVANPRLKIEETICGAPPSVQLVIGCVISTCVFPLLLRLPLVLRACVYLLLPLPLSVVL